VTLLINFGGGSANVAESNADEASPSSPRIPSSPLIERWKMLYGRGLQATD
jgi:hypothetical protein